MKTRVRFFFILVRIYSEDDICYLKWSVGFAKVHLQEIDPEGDLNLQIVPPLLCSPSRLKSPIQIRLLMMYHLSANFLSHKFASQKKKCKKLNH